MVINNSDEKDGIIHVTKTIIEQLEPLLKEQEEHAKIIKVIKILKKEIEDIEKEKKTK